MRRRWIVATAGALLAGQVAAWAEEGFLARTWNGVRRDWQRNNAWYDPFVPGDRAAVRQPFEISVNNGWRLQNTLSDFFFDESGRLTEAGELKVKTIMQENAPQRRFVLVLKADDPSVTQTRMSTTYQAAARFALAGDTASVDETVLKPYDWPASYVYAVEQSRTANMLAPVLPPRAGGAAGGGAQSTGAAGT